MERCICIAIVTAGIVFMFAIAKWKVKRNRKQIKIWRSGRVE